MELMIRKLNTVLMIRKFCSPDVETDKDSRPVHPAPKILSVEVLWNPFDDIVPRQVTKNLAPPVKSDNDQNKQKQKAVKKLNVLTFGDKVEEDEKESESIKEKIRSIHDVLDDPRFLKGEPTEDLMNSTENEKKKGIQKSVREALASKRNEPNKDHKFDTPYSFDYSNDDDEDDDEGKFDARMRSQILKKCRELEIISHEKLSTSIGSKSTKKDRVLSPRIGDDDDDHHAGRKSKIEKLSVKKNGVGSEAKAEQLAQADTDLQLLSHAEQERQILKQEKRQNQGHEEDTLAKLEKFAQSLANKLRAPARGNSEDTAADDLGWLSYQVKFAPDHAKGKDAMDRKVYSDLLDGLHWLCNPQD